jgi:hypothetical protein
VAATASTVISLSIGRIIGGGLTEDQSGGRSPA